MPEPERLYRNERPWLTALAFVGGMATVAAGGALAWWITDLIAGLQQ